MPIEKKLITIDGVRFAYEEYGEGEPVVFIHGFPASSYSWRKIARWLSDSYHTVCIDLMGFGDSDKPRAESYTLERQSELVRSAITQLGLARPVLVGHSMGGGVCLSIAREFESDPGAIRGLVLVDCVCYPQRLPWFIWALRIPLFPLLGMKLIPEKWGFRLLQGAMYHPRNGMSSEAMDEYARSLQSKGGHAALMEVAKQIVPNDIVDFVSSYSRISIPTQIIWGRQDKVIPLELGKRLAEQTGAQEIHVVDTCGHCPQEEHPEQVYTILRHFLASICPD